ncbi:mitotic checkpoint serine/threonine-protein kinase BUB1 beta [Carcharodon carcharias]|uniref:mitotic checkpoint serine/threonine-protein kinase BUB1 beta n=1 Tax=Carcharodon carcharias TaxID=13397 RepID=UPI001B7E7E02|nr:mitotic checkpoint serine/threonine-protein kinase BUB1 beta [Carcharodon carcharias]XP_041069751.1 mitotic checkpoint serine/threonine-protein kinase BUB1 beta [Carcharodon carcharias]
MAEADWELSKENVQPLKQGRDVSTLQDVLAQHEGPSQISIQEQKLAFEAEIRFYSGDDPLDVWDRYIKWTEQMFPHGGTDSNHSALLERVLKLFLKDERYYSDLRYLGHWLKFVDYCTDPLEIFDFLKSKGIGVPHAALYVAWAERYELLGNNKKAEAILQEGIQLQAEPLEKLQHHLRHFQSRVFKQVVASIAEGTNEDFVPDPVQQQRTILGDLKRRGQKKAMAPVNRVGNSVRSQNQGLGQNVAPAQEQGGRFEVFNENRLQTQPADQLRSTEGQWTVLPSTSAKENEIAPGPWNTSGIRMPRHSNVHAFTAALSANRPDFKLYEEEFSHEETTTPRKIEPLFTPVLSARKPSKELNPLLRVQVQNCKEEKEVSMYSKDQIYAGLREFSFEELRAEEFKKKYKARIKEQEQKLSKLKQEKEEMEQLIHMAEMRMKQQQEHNQLETQQMEAIDNPVPHSGITTREFGTELNPSERKPEDPCRDGLNASRLKNMNLSGYTDIKTNMFHDHVTCSQMSGESRFEDLGAVSSDCNKEDLEYEAQFMKCADRSHSNSVPALMPPFFGLPSAPTPFSIFEENADIENQENKPPANYLKTSTRWQLSGILVPSQRVLTEGACAAECDDLDGIEPLNEDHFVSSDYPNKTLGPYPENTCDFTRGAHLVSTPFHRNPLTDDQENSIKQNSIDGSKSALSSLSPIKESLFDQPLHLKKLSPIQEASEDGLSSAATTTSSAVSSSSVGGLGTMSDLNVFEKLELGQLNSCETNNVNSTSGNPWDIEVRNQLLLSLSVPLSSLPEFHIQDSPIPTLEDGLELHLGSQAFNVKQAAVHEQYRVFFGTNSSLNLSKAIIKVYSHTVPWDFYINQQLKMRLGSQFNNYFSQNHSCYLFENGCVTVDEVKNCETLQGLSQMWESVPEALVLFLTHDLLALVELMHTAEIVHGDIALETLFMGDRFYNVSMCPSSDSLVKLMDFTHSLDLRLQSDVANFTKFPTVQSLPNKELLLECTNAYQVDLLGIANTVHFLLFGRHIDVSKEGSRWILGPMSYSLEQWLYMELWNSFFEKILNAGDAPSVSTLRDLRQTVTEVIEPDYETLYNDAFILNLTPYD